jgi:hypothetical protein
MNPSQRDVKRMPMAHQPDEDDAAGPGRLRLSPWRCYARRSVDGVVAHLRSVTFRACQPGIGEGEGLHGIEQTGGGREPPWY